MTYQEEMYAHLVNGGDPKVLFDAFMKDLNEAQKKADAQLEKEKQEAAAEAAKKAAEKEIKVKKEVARKEAIAAVSAYYTLVYPEFSAEDLEYFSKAAVDSFAQSVELVKALESGKHISLMDIFG
jgi:membrane protein involved in colicin uptake